MTAPIAMNSSHDDDDARARRMAAALLAAAVAADVALCLVLAVLFSNHPAVLAAAAAIALALAWAVHARGAALIATVQAELPPMVARVWERLAPGRPHVAAAAALLGVAAMAAGKLGLLLAYALALRAAERAWPHAARAVRHAISRAPGGLVYVHAW